MKQMKHQKEAKLCKYTPATLALTIFHPKQPHLHRVLLKVTPLSRLCDY